MPDRDKTRGSLPRFERPGSAADFRTAVTALRGLMTDPSSDDGVDWEGWALAAFRHQFGGCEPLRAWWAARGVTPDTVARWQDIPPVPAEAFKYFDFRAPTDLEPEAVFLTSGTSGGTARRGRHSVLSLELYVASMSEPMRKALDPLGAVPNVLSLVPRAEERPDSSLSVMVTEGAKALGLETYWCVASDGSWVLDEFDRFDSARSDRPVLVMATALALVHLLDESRLAPVLPEGSVVMETGGFKGVRSDVSRTSLYRRLVSAFEVDPDRIVNEYGMTELLSQLWEPVLTVGSKGRGLHRPPPWLRVRALDPDSLEELPEGRSGLLAFFDLANFGSVSHVVTQDVGAVIDGHVRLEGRVLGSEPRGCSRTMDELMSGSGKHA